jgi:beta-N-acetylhexosaminidase
MIEEARKHLGQMILTGFQGLELSDVTSAFLSQAGIGGVILFAHNYENPAQLAELVNQIQGCRGDLPLWISVDHEGGRVQRFRTAPFTKLPDAQTIGKVDSPKQTFDLFELAARELKAVGVNLNFAPVADILTNPKNTAIGNRAFGSNEEQVTKIVTAVLRGHLIAGVQPCVKHFPGHGDTPVDSHHDLPCIETPLTTLREREFRPFTRAFRSRCAMVMVGHLLNPTVDPDRPATLSRKWLQEILRGELRYNRVIVTDDLEMKAVTKHYSPEQIVREAVAAGCDLLVYKTEAAARHAYSTLLKDLEAGDLSPQTVLDSARRLRELKQEALLPYAPLSVSDVAPQLGKPELQELVDKFEQMAKGR